MHYAFFSNPLPPPPPERADYLPQFVLNVVRSLACGWHFTAIADEWWLMEEAKRRNPAVKLYALSWGAPGWIGNGQFYSQDNINYHITWLQGAKSAHNLTLDYMGIWWVFLRGGGTWGICSRMLQFR